MSVRLLCALALAFAAASSTASAAELLKTGDEFPDWHMVAHTGTSVTSEAYIGRTYLMWFYPSALTPSCTAEGRGFTEHLRAFQENSVDILGVSFDPPEANAAFVQAERFAFPLLSDTERTLAMQVGAADSRDERAAKRISYLVGSDGRVVRVYEHFEPARHAEQVLTDLSMP
jgi:peroxiredoxin Q/BCP